MLSHRVVSNWMSPLYINRFDDWSETFDAQRRSGNSDRRSDWETFLCSY